MGAALALDSRYQLRQDLGERAELPAPSDLLLSGSPTTLQRGGGHVVVSGVSLSGCFARTLHPHQDGAPALRKSADSKIKCARDELKDKLSRALARRLYPNGPWHGKTLAHAIGCSPDTIRRALHRQHDAVAHFILSLARLFRDGGDVSFMSEVFGDEIIAMPPTARPAELLREALRQIETTKP